MPTNDYMRAEAPVQSRRSEASPARKQPRTWLEIVLAVAGFAAWLWCAFQVMRPLP
jgi:hypothetical protein